MIALVTGFFSGLWGRVAVAAGIAAFLIGLFVVIENLGAERVRAAIAIQGEADNAAAGQVRSEVDGLSDSAISERLRRFQRK